MNIEPEMAPRRVAWRRRMGEIVGVGVGQVAAPVEDYLVLLGGERVVVVRRGRKDGWRWLNVKWIMLIPETTVPGSSTV